MSLDRGLAAGVLALLTFASAIVGQAPAAAQEPTAPVPVGSVGIRLLEAPVSLQDDPRALAYIIDNLPPGTTITRRIEVSNSSDQEQAISLYPAAASIADGGDGFEVAEDRTANELTTWMTVEPTDVSLAPNAAAEAVVTIAVPADAPEGEQYAVVWAQTAGAPNATGIQNVSRVGIRTYLSVGPGNGPPADLEIDGVTAARNADGAPTVVASISNTGGRALDPSGTITLSDGPGGISTAPTQGSGGSIAPGQSGEITFALDSALPAGPWQAAVSVASGLVNKSTTVDLTFPEQGSAAATSSDGIPSWLWIVVAVVVVALVAGAVLAVRRRKAN
ncbi:hypothetical protein [Rhodococcoides kyotonense]|uniref:Peptidase n=1 Tax=Rhodococcoides kyotonense TaxID=398843 RepID=A0A239EI43_9NOCA|nr:hypothetical protein [Rhodococcus kyotonensis]SNS44316.1 hypothetical protein SAMN05421642_102400 [Rhodococcus kyotonensis]